VFVARLRKSARSAGAALGDAKKNVDAILGGLRD
jgi:hypothetical protein